MRFAVLKFAGTLDQNLNNCICDGASCSLNDILELYFSIFWVLYKSCFCVTKCRIWGNNNFWRNVFALNLKQA